MTKEEQAALDAVMNFLDSYSRRSIEDCMSAIATSKPLLMFGTNDNEVFRTTEDVRAAFTKDFASMANIRWGKHRNVHVEAVSTLAFVMIELPISYLSEGKNVETLFRYALTLTQESGQWKICSGMASVPFATGTYVF